MYDRTDWSVFKLTIHTNLGPSPKIWLISLITGVVSTGWSRYTLLGTWIVVIGNIL